MRNFILALMLSAALPLQAVHAEEKRPDVKGEIKKEVYTYDSGGRRDPFLSLITAARFEKEKRKKGLTPLEDFDLSQMNLSAIIGAGGGFYALIGLPDGKHYTITEGMSLGIHGGKVIRIAESSLLVREYVRDYRGVSLPRDTVLRLHKEEQ